MIVGIDPTGDVALIKLLGREDFPAAELADSDQVRVGDWCFTIGNPFLLATDFQPSVAYGRDLGHPPLPVSGRHDPRIHRTVYKPTRPSTPATREGLCSIPAAG